MTFHSLVRPQRLSKEVGLFKTISKVASYVPMEALEICLVPKELEFKYVLKLWKSHYVFP
jgi:hypothetical protein